MLVSYDNFCFSFPSLELRAGIDDEDGKDAGVIGGSSVVVVVVMVVVVLVVVAPLLLYDGSESAEDEADEVLDELLAEDEEVGIFFNE